MRGVGKGRGKIGLRVGKNQWNGEKERFAGGGKGGRKVDIEKGKERKGCKGGKGMEKYVG